MSRFAALLVVIGLAPAIAEGFLTIGELPLTTGRVQPNIATALGAGSNSPSGR
jgi:hypothetical protein